MSLHLVQPVPDFVCICGEVFPVPVWHCPLDAHHWPMGRQDCHNCHNFAAPTKPGRYGTPIEFEEEEAL